jgi:hypothetical protein
MVVPAPQFVKFRLTFSSCGGAITLARVGILNNRCREIAKMLDLRAGRGCCLILAWSQRPIDRQNPGTSPSLGIRGLGPNQAQMICLVSLFSTSNGLLSPALAGGKSLSLT